MLPRVRDKQSAPDWSRADTRMVAIDGGEKKRFSDARITVFVDEQEGPSYRFAAILLGALAFVGGRIDALMRGD